MAVVNGLPNLFRWLLLSCLISDIADGWIARRFNLRSEFGATLDSRADIAVQAVALVGIWSFHKIFVTEYRLPLLMMVTMYEAEILMALWRYGRVSSFHTLMYRLAASALGVFVMSLFFGGFSPFVFYSAFAMSILAASEEMVILYLLPKWEADVGGLYWVLNRKDAIAP
jgi:CDP-diacylglycerol--glycerol-3-phosphate 3-phosphatidyltransferase